MHKVDAYTRKNQARFKSAGRVRPPNATAITNPFRVKEVLGMTPLLEEGAGPNKDGSEQGLKGQVNEYLR